MLTEKELWEFVDWAESEEQWNRIIQNLRLPPYRMLPKRVGSAEVKFLLIERRPDEILGD